ncbi:hypothetical protein C2S53_012306 [Perilla frutescens var. hirtella]|uniref:Uncharacterized protein n=1 Tax=Perilla frutescens var. hirtella TaxID=608512 RepID=A0AAD4IXV7_PERFH|nr:hypothetical protein C2S53_012306 [Perilla frutescens var. hirtella]
MLLFGTAAVVVSLDFSSKGSTVLNPGMVSVGNMNAVTLTLKRKLKQNKNMDDNDIPKEEAEDADDDGVVDYGAIDPIPSSTTASITHAPIQHASPLMPFVVPKPSPPPSPID